MKLMTAPIPRRHANVAEKPKEILEVYNTIVSSLVGIPEVNFQLTRPY